MKHLFFPEHSIRQVDNFQDLVSTPFQGAMNAICWTRKLAGDFSELVGKLTLAENIRVVERSDLLALELTEQGQLARDILLNDLELLKAYGASPVLNLIRCYERDTTYPFFPTDVYSFHADRSPIATDTFLCTYHGAPSELLPNAQAEQKIRVPELRDALKKLYGGKEEGFEPFLREHFFDLHYRAQSMASPISLGLGHLWRLAVDYPESPALPCIHRAPEENDGQLRLLMIC